MEKPIGSGREALLIPKRKAFESIGVGNTTGYRLINEGLIIARKLGSKTMVEAESLQRFVSSLPRVTKRDAL